MHHWQEINEGRQFCRSWKNLDERKLSAMDIPLVIGVISSLGLTALLVVLMERSHRRTARLSRTPFGADLEGDRDIARTLAEIEAVRARTSAEKPPSKGTGSDRAAGRHQPARSPARQAAEFWE